MFKKIIASIILACFIFVNVGVHVVETVHAQNTWYHQSFPDWAARVYDETNPDEIFGERYTAAQVEWVIWGIFGFFINHAVGNSGLVGCIMRESMLQTSDYLSCAPLLRETLDTFRDAGIIGADMDSETSLATTNPVQDILSGARPISGIGYIRSAASKFGVPSEVHAQGFGFTAAESMRTLWVAVRNVTYFFLILLVIIMAFMIMFRFKISPQTVITVQSALPQLIIALILITFSYAIAGFMIDLLYVVIGLIAAVLYTSGLFDLTWVEMYNRLTGATFGTGIVGSMVIYFVGFTVIGAVASLSVVSLMSILAMMFSVIILIVAVIALFFITIKIMWMLFKTYVSILLLIVAGPIYIITGGFTNWLKNLASNLAVFAVIGPMFALSFLFLFSGLPDWGAGGDGFFSLFDGIFPFQPRINAIGDDVWVPPFLAVGNMNLIWVFASFVIITLIPNAANIIKSMIQGKPFGYGTAVGAAVGAAAGTAWAPFATQAGAAKETWAKARGQAIYDSIAQSRYGEALKGFIKR